MQPEKSMRLAECTRFAQHRKLLEDIDCQSVRLAYAGSVELHTNTIIITVSDVPWLLLM